MRAERCSCTHQRDDHTEGNGCEVLGCTCTWWESLEDWIAEAQAKREAKREQHRLLQGPELREELQRVRALGKQARHRRRLELLAARTREEQ